MEESLEVSLFDRVGRGLVLSAAGRALRPRAEALLEAAREAAEQTRLAAREAYFDVKLGTIDSLAANLFPQTIAAVREAFEGLTLGRRRHYNLHFSRAKKAATRVSRIDAATERILMGKGLRDCICGRSKRLPSCDGSHRELDSSS